MDQQMQDKTVSLTDVCSWVLWVIAVGLVVVQIAGGWPLGQLGLIAAAAAATLTIRGYFVDLLAREQNAFLIGRDSARKVR